MPAFGTTDPARDLVLMLDTGVVLYTLLFAAVFVVQWLRAPLRKWTDPTLSWAIFMAGMAFNSVFFILSDFFLAFPPWLEITTRLGYLSMIVALIAFFFVIETIIPYTRYHIASGLGVFFAVLTIVIPFDLMDAVALIASLETMLILSLFLLYAIRNTSGRVRRSMETIAVGFLIGFLGYIGRSEFAYNSLGPSIYLLAAVFLVAGLLLLGATVLSSPSLDELNWREQLLELYVIGSAGLLLYDHTFQPATDMDRHLAAAGIAGVQLLFKEILNSREGLNSLAVGDTHVMFGHGEGFTVVLIARKPYRILADKIIQFIQMLELVFRRELTEETVRPIDPERAGRIVSAVFA